MKHQNKSQENYAIKCRLPPFAFGSFVWLEDQTPASQGLRSKLRRKFIGPFGIVKLTSDKTYWLVNSTKVSSIRDFKRADAKRLKHYSEKDNKIVKTHQKLLKLIYEKVKDIKDLPKHLQHFHQIFQLNLKTINQFKIFSIQMKKNLEMKSIVRHVGYESV